jgi:CheY-like chemotaxis protein
VLDILCEEDKALAARLIADETAAPEIAAGAMVELSDETEVKVTTATRGLSVLVAEDNEINALLMRSLLTRLGLQAVGSSAPARPTTPASRRRSSP